MKKCLGMLSVLLAFVSSGAFAQEGELPALYDFTAGVHMMQVSITPYIVAAIGLTLAFLVIKIGLRWLKKI